MLIRHVLLTKGEKLVELLTAFKGIEEIIEFERQLSKDVVFLYYAEF